MPTELVGDSYTIADALGTFAPYAIALGDSYTLSDAIIAQGRVVLIPALFTDTLTFTDAIDFRIGPTNTIAVGDSFTFVDLLKTSRTQSNPVTDSVSVSDSIAVTLWLGIGVADTLAANWLDSATATPNSIFTPITESVSDRLFFVDSLQASSVPFATFADVLYLADSVLIFSRPTFGSYLRRYLNDVS
jgi:hypothetical protein